MDERGLENGMWEGEYIDVNGVRATLRLDLDVKDNKVTGTFEAVFQAEDQPQMMRGDLSGYTEKGQVRVQLPIGPASDKERGKAEMVEFSAQLSDAGSHARQAVFGVVSSAPRSNLGGGVFIAWRFDKPQG